MVADFPISNFSSVVIGCYYFSLQKYKDVSFARLLIDDTFCGKTSSFVGKGMAFVVFLAEIRKLLRIAVGMIADGYIRFFPLFRFHFASKCHFRNAF
jgi:hypothetical protein